MKTKKEQFVDMLNENSMKNKTKSYEISFRMWVAMIIGKHMNENNLNQKKMAELLGKTETQLSYILNANTNLTIKSIAEILTKIDYREDFVILNAVKPIVVQKKPKKRRSVLSKSEVTLSESTKDENTVTI